MARLLHRPRVARASLLLMATKKPETAAAPRKSRSGPSGPTTPNAERKAAGQIRIEVWIDADTGVLLDEIQVAQDASRKAAVAMAIQVAAPLLTKKK
jgi:hypothetical protein